MLAMNRTTLLPATYITVPYLLRSGLVKRFRPRRCFVTAAQLGNPDSAVPLALPHHVYDLAAATASSSDSISNDGGWLAPLSNGLETVLKYIQSYLDAGHVPYSYGWSIVVLTLLVKVTTFPLTRQQIESSMAVQTLKPRLDLIKARFGEDKERIQKETSRLYEKAGVNPLAGCLPTLATIPIFIGLYRSLTNVATEGLLDTQGFYWIPSLAGPTSIAARQAGSGTAWLLPLVDGHPPIGWDDASKYLVLPVLLVLVQYISTSIVSPPVDPNAENATQQKLILALLPLMIGWFSLNVPSGLSLYYFSNSIFTSAIQIYLKKLGGARIRINDLGPVTKLASGRRLGPVVQPQDMWEVPEYLLPKDMTENTEAAAGQLDTGLGEMGVNETAAETVEAAAGGPKVMDRMCKRKKLVASTA